MNFRSVLYIIALAFLSGCASYEPIVDENEKYEEVGEEVAERDIQRCVKRADRYLKKHKRTKMAKDAGRGAMTGAVIGGALGLLTGGGVKNTAIAAGTGAAIGAGTKTAKHLAKDNLTPDELKQRYVSKCLARKGYDVIGWK